MSRRIYRRVSALVITAAACIALVFAAVPAGATSSHPGSPFYGACDYHIGWGGDASNFDAFQGACYWRSMTLCGVYPNGATYHWLASPYYNDAVGHPTRNFWVYCPAGESVLNLGVVVSGGPGGWDCWNQNANNWAWNRGDMPCY